DYVDTLKSLWESDRNKAKLIALWKKLAERYASKEWIGAYDLINEPNWDFENSGNKNGCNCNQNVPLLNLYKALIDTIRLVDKNHMVIVEGNCWGNRYNGMYSLATYDDNIAFSFHKYWNYNDEGSISGLLGLRNTYNVPLWCGESGENSNNWYTNAISLLEKNKIGWAWWSYKKFNSYSGTNSVLQTADYDKIISYFKNGTTTLTAETAKPILMKMADNLKLENCVTNYPVIDAMFRQVKSTETKPYKPNKVPGVIFFSDFDFGRNNYAYFDTDTANYQVSTNAGFTAWNSGYAYRSDGVDIQECTDATLSNGYNVGWTVAGEWMKYTVSVDSTAAYRLHLRFAGQNATKMHMTVDGYDATNAIILSATGDWQKWATDSSVVVVLTKGVHAIKFFTDEGGCNLNYFQLKIEGAANSVSFKPISAGTSFDGKRITLVLSHECKKPFVASLAEFVVQTNKRQLSIESIGIGIAESDRVVYINLIDTIAFDEIVTVDYSGTSIINTTENTLDKFEKFPVTNNLPVCVVIPAKIEAESYYFQSGLQTESCTEGGLNLGYTNAGDYMDYYIMVKNAGQYPVSFRVSALNPGGIIELQIINGSNKTVLGTFNVPQTNGWQNWQTISGTVTLTQGSHLLRFYIKSPEFNINWFSIGTVTGISKMIKNEEVKLYPNPCSNILTIQSDKPLNNAKFAVFDVTGRKYEVIDILQNACIATINTERFEAGNYFLMVTTTNGVVSKPFTVR
ncbi:MAG TPA: carbohydrate-binding protein, partial [Bacteroidales bacterium]